MTAMQEILKTLFFSNMHRGRKGKNKMSLNFSSPGAAPGEAVHALMVIQ